MSYFLPFNFLRYNKKGDIFNPLIYRQAILLPNITKVNEKVIFMRTTSFLGKYKVFNLNQNDYMSGWSIKRALFKIVANGNYTTGIYLDLFKGFDSIKKKHLTW